MELLTKMELQALAELINRAPKLPAEALWAASILQRLWNFCNPPEVPVDAGASEKEEPNETL